MGVARINCTKCRLHSTRTQIAWGTGPPDSQLLFVGEGPGKQEDENGVPFYPYAPAGMEFTNLLARIGINRDDVRIDNLVKCRCPNDRDPKPDEISACEEYLLMDLLNSDYKYVVPMGVFAARWFLGNDFSMEMGHGIPYEWDCIPEIGVLVIYPVYHPAAGLHRPDVMIRVQQDFAGLRDLIQGKRPTRHREDPYEGREDYREHEPGERIYHEGIIALDTETIDDNRNWCTTYSTRPGWGRMVRADSHESLIQIASIVGDPDVTTLLHNAPFDIPVLAQVNIYPANPVCTMTMAYLLQSEPQGLKPLAYRHCGMEMKSYSEMVATATLQNARNYLETASCFTFPDPDPVLKWVKGEPKSVQPRNIVKKIKGILKDVETKNADPWDRWHKIKPEEGRGQVEDRIGLMRPGDLSQIPLNDAVDYACRDADAAFRIFPYLLSRIESFGLQDALRIDMEAIPMILDMMKNGFLTNPDYLRGLSSYFEQRLGGLDREVNKYAGVYPIQVTSPDQVAWLLFTHLGLKPLKKTKSGERESTEAGVLARLVGDHPVVATIQEFREVSKLKTTYTDQLPKMVDGNNRIHTTLKTTRTATGRLSSADPNLQNIPIRTEDGRKIRKGFRAQDGCKLVSADYSQIELRILAHESQDSKMLEVFRAGGDIHSWTASQMTGIPIDELDPMEHRYPAKHINFGIAYGISGEGLYHDFAQAGLKGWTRRKCKDFIGTWFEIFSGARKYIDGIHQFAKLHGYVTDMFGRIRWIPGVKGASRKVKQEALRMAGNMPIQSGAAGIIKKAMKDTRRVCVVFSGDGYICKPILQVHDDLIFEIEDGLVNVFTSVIVGAMESVVELSLDTPVDAKFGDNWEEMEKWKQ